jgi:hypothetical protein
MESSVGSKLFVCLIWAVEFQTRGMCYKPSILPHNILRMQHNLSPMCVCVCVCVLILIFVFKLLLKLNFI